jgi:hypothetical protein
MNTILIEHVTPYIFTILLSETMGQAAALLR